MEANGYHIHGAEKKKRRGRIAYNPRKEHGPYDLTTLSGRYW